MLYYNIIKNKGKLMTKRIISKSVLAIFMCSALFAQEAISENYNEAADEVQLISDDSENEVTVIHTDDEYDQLAETNESDEYEDELSQEEIDSYDSVPAGTPKKKNNFFSNLFTLGNKGQFIYLDDSSTFYKTLTGKLKQTAATATINPNNGEAGFSAKCFSTFNIIMMDAKSRAKLTKAVNQYFKDFEEKKLNRKSVKTLRAYGKTKITLRWGTIKTSTPNNGVGDIMLGYTFINNSPYFTISIPPFQNKYYENKPIVSESAQINYYFTKAQISSLLKMISEENITNAINAYNNEQYGIPQDSDDY